MTLLGLYIFLAGTVSLASTAVSLTKTACFKPPVPSVQEVQAPSGVSPYPPGWESDSEPFDDLDERVDPRQRLGKTWPPGSLGGEEEWEADEEPELEDMPRERAGATNQKGAYFGEEMDEFEMEEKEESPQAKIPWNTELKKKIAWAANSGWSRGRGWGEEEMEWDRRKKRQTPESIIGNLTCDTGSLEKIRVINVTVGYSFDGVCASRRPRCRKDATSESQVSLCDGESFCELNFLQKTFGECPRPINFVDAEYECLPDDSTYNVCDWKSDTKSGPVVITSPGYPSGDPSKAGQFLTCECILTTDSTSTIAMSAVRSTLSGTEGKCADDILLVEKRDMRDAKKFQVVEELCGNVRREKTVLESNAVRITYLSQVLAVPNRKGFLTKFEVVSPNSRPGAVRVRCRDLSEGLKSQGDIGIPVPVLSTVPPKKTTTSTAASAAGAGAVLGNDGDDKNKKNEAAASTGGLMSAVVASLSSIIIIMTSLVVYFLYRRSQKKKRQHFQQQSVRSDVTWFNDPVYRDPEYTQSDFPERMKSSQSQTTEISRMVDSCTYTSDQKAVPVPVSPLPVPDCPVPPPRRNKKRRQEASEETQYDNVGFGGEEATYACISDIKDMDITEEEEGK